MTAPGVPRDSAIERLRYRIGETGIAGESALLEEALAEAAAGGLDAQMADLLAALNERNIQSRGDLALWERLYAAEDGRTLCRICHLSVLHDNTKNHLRGARHKRYARLAQEQPK